MRAKVYGQVGNGPVMVRVVTISQLFDTWGIWAMAIFHARKNSPLIVRDKRIWIELVD